MGITKLDSYDCVTVAFPGVISVHVDGINDPALVDILSEINRTDGKIYFDGQYYLYLNNYRLHSQGKDSYIELDVMKLD